MSKQAEPVTVTVVDARKPQEFFSLNGTYLIAPDATRLDLVDDAQCWLGAATEIVNTLAIELGNESSNMHADPKSAARMLWGAFHLLGMVDGAIGASASAKEGRS